MNETARRDRGPVMSTLMVTSDQAWQVRPDGTGFHVTHYGALPAGKPSLVNLAQLEQLLGPRLAELTEIDESAAVYWPPAQS